MRLRRSGAVRRGVQGKGRFADGRVQVKGGRGCSAVTIPLHGGVNGFRPAIPMFHSRS